MTLSPEDRHRIYLEEKARLEYRSEPSRFHLSPPQRQAKKTRFGRVVGKVLIVTIGLLVILFIIGFLVVRNSDSDISTARTSASESTGNPAQDRLIRLAASGQAIALGQLTGESCDGDLAFYMGIDKANNVYWSVHCTNGRSYQVQIQPDAKGSTGIMDCDVLKAVANLSCFSKLK